MRGVSESPPSQRGGRVYSGSRREPAAYLPAASERITQRETRVRTLTGGSQPFHGYALNIYLFFFLNHFLCKLLHFNALALFTPILRRWAVKKIKEHFNNESINAESCCMRNVK